VIRTRSSAHPPLPQHFLGMSERGARQPLAAEHAGNFSHTLFTVDMVYGAEGGAGLRPLCLATTRCWSAQAATCGRWVTAMHLAVLAQLFHQPADGFGHGAADARIDLVEDQRLRRPSWLVVTAMASAMRDNSPPEATLPTGRGVLPLWPATRNSACRPARSWAGCASGCSATSKRPPCMPSPCMACVMALASLRRGFGPCLAQRARLGQVGLAGALLRSFESGQVGRGIQPCQVVLPAGQQRRKVGRLALVAAGQRHPGPHAFVELRQPLRIEVGAAQVGVQRMRGILGLGQAGRQYLGQVAELGLQVLLRLQGGVGRREPRRGAAVFGFQGVERGLRRIQQRLRMRQPGVAGVQVVPLVGARSQLVDLADLPGQAFAFALQRILRGAGLGECLLRRRHCCQSCCSLPAEVPA
jgi:hypothetical protein